MNTQNGIIAIAELKEIVGKLWKSVDSFKISSAQEDRRIQDQIGEWTQTNLQLLKLLTAKTGEVERLAQNYSRLTNSLNRFDQEWQALHQQIEQLNAILMTSKHGTQSIISTSELRQLKQEMSSLNDSVRSAISTYPLTVITPNQQTSNWNDWAHYGISVVLVGGLMLVSIVGKWQLDHIQQRVEWNLIKLQRLEQR